MPVHEDAADLASAVHRARATPHIHLLGVVLRVLGESGLALPTALGLVEPADWSTTPNSPYLAISR